MVLVQTDRFVASPQRYLVSPMVRYRCEMFAVYIILGDGTGRLLKGTERWSKAEADRLLKALRTGPITP
jgi:hypothetical protein